MSIWLEGICLILKGEGKNASRLKYFSFKQMKWKVLLAFDVDSARCM